MRAYTRNLTYYGFVRFLGSAKVVLTEAVCVSCSQIVRTFANETGKIEDAKVLEFYIPNDWLGYQFKNEYFMKWWMDLVEKWFHKVTWEGKFKGGELGLSNATFNQSFGYPGKLDTMFLRHRGDYIVNNVWHKFSMKIDRNNPGYNFKMYCAYCMVRYLFASSYQDIVRDFMYSFRAVATFDIAGEPVFNTGVDPFKLFQLMHYGLANYNDGYYGTFSVIPQIGANENCFKLKSLKEVIDYFEAPVKPGTNKSIHGAFGAARTNVLKTRIQESLKMSQIEKAYDEIL